MVLQKKEPCSQRKAWACASKRRLDAVRVHLAAAVLSGPERVAELVITLMLAEGREERREALLKLERQLDRCSEADAEAAMEAGVVHVLTPIAVVTGDAEWDRAAAVAANILATLSLLTRDGSMGDSPRDASRLVKLIPPAVMKVAGRGVGAPSPTLFAALCGAAFAGDGVARATAVDITARGSTFFNPSPKDLSTAVATANAKALVGLISSEGGRDGSFADARVLGACHALRLLVSGDAATAAGAMEAGLAQVVASEIGVQHGVARPLLWACLASTLHALPSDQLDLPRVLSAQLLQPALLDLDARGVDPLAPLRALPHGSVDAFTELDGGADVHPDHRASLAQLHIWALVSTLQAVGTHSEQGAVALQAVGGAAWLEVELLDHSWCVVESEDTPAGAAGREKSNNDKGVEEPFWKEEEDALKELLSTGRARWVEEGGAENPQHAGEEMPKADTPAPDADGLDALLRSMGGDDGESKIRQEEQEHSPEDDTDKQLAAQQVEREAMAKAIADWESMALKPAQQAQPSDDIEPLRSQLIDWDRDSPKTKRRQQPKKQGRPQGARHEHSVRHGDSDVSTPAALPASSQHLEQLVKQLQGKWVDGDGAKITVSGRNIEIFRPDSQPPGIAGEPQNGLTSQWHIDFVERTPEEQEEDLGSGVFHGTSTLWFGGSRLLLPHELTHPRWKLDSSQKIRVWQSVDASVHQRNDAASAYDGIEAEGQYERMLPPEMPPPPAAQSMPPKPPTTHSRTGAAPGHSPMPAMPAMPAMPSPPPYRPHVQLPIGTTAVSAHELAELTTRLKDSFGTAQIGSELGVDVEELIDAIGAASRAMHALRAAIDLSVAVPDADAFRRQLKHLRALLL